MLYTSLYSRLFTCRYHFLFATLQQATTPRIGRRDTILFRAGVALPRICCTALRSALVREPGVVRFSARRAAPQG